jgi:hypothetical protein
LTFLELLALVRRYDDIDIVKFGGSARVPGRRTIAALTGTSESIPAGIVQVRLAQLRLVQSIAMIGIFDRPAEIDRYKPPTGSRERRHALF